MTSTRAQERSPAVALVVTGAISVQFGAALATKLFGRVGPLGAATLRLAIAAVIVLGIVGGTRALGVRPAPRPTSASDRAVAIVFGLVLAGMNLSFYEAIARVPLGVAVTIEFSGPLALALVGSRRWSDGLWAVGAGGGVALLATGAGRHLDPVGLGLALLAGSLWAGYILLSKETGRRFESLDGLAWAMSAGGLALMGFGLGSAGSALFRPAVLGLGAVVAILSSAIPYSLELLALRRLTPRTFGVLMSLDPALATAAGFLVLGQHLTFQEWAALALVVVANAGNALTGRTGGVGIVP